MKYNIEEMSQSELVEFAKKVSNSLLDTQDKSKLFKLIDARTEAFYEQNKD